MHFIAGHCVEYQKKFLGTCSCMYDINPGVRLGQTGTILQVRMSTIDF